MNLVLASLNNPPLLVNGFSNLAPFCLISVCREPSFRSTTVSKWVLQLGSTLLDQCL